MQLDLSKKTAVMTFTPRTEHHGDGLASRSTLHFSVDLPNAILSEIDPSLRNMLYCKEDDSQTELLEETLTKLRIPALKPNYPLSLEWKGIGYEMVLEVGVSGHSNITLDLCNIDKVKYEPKEGGTVNVKFNVACDPSEKDVGTIYALMGKEVTLTLVAPTAEKMAEINKAKPQTEPLFADADKSVGSKKSVGISNEEQLAQAATALSKNVGKDPTADDVFGTKEERAAKKSNNAWPFPTGKRPEAA